MSVFTTVSETEISDFLLHYRCGEFISLQGIAEGISNSNYLLTTTSGKFIFTIYEHIDPINLGAILKLQNHLKNEGIACAKIFSTINQSLFHQIAGKPATLLEKLEGDINYPITVSLCKQVGETLAKFHQAANNFEFSVNNFRGAGWISRVAQQLMDHLSVQDQVILQQELDYLSQYSQLALPSGPIHADLFPDNVLVKEDRLIGIIDFDLACREVYLFDICVAINAWCSDKNGQLDRFKMRDLLTAYSSIRPLSELENIAIPMMLRVTALRFWLSRLHDFIFPADGELTFHKNPDVFKAILLARRQRLSGMQR